MKMKADTHIHRHIWLPFIKIAKYMCLIMDVRVYVCVCAA